MQKLSWLILILTLALFSCQKEVSETLTTNRNTSDSSAAKIRTIRIVNSDPSDPLNVTVAIEYDSVNRKVKVYLDDPATNNTQMDLLSYVYEFNPAGYLATIHSLDDNMNLVPEIIFNRDASNRLVSILENDLHQNGQGGPVTHHFSYQSNNGLQIVMDSTSDQSGPGYMKFVRSFSGQRVISAQRYITYSGALDWNDTFSYNAQGQLVSRKGTHDTTDIVYQNTPSPTGWDGQDELFLGKDAYLLNAFPRALGGNDSYHFMSFLYNTPLEIIYNVLFMPPVSTVSLHGFWNPNYSMYDSSQVQFTNTFTSDNKMAKIVVAIPGRYAVSYSFGY